MERLKALRSRVAAGIDASTAMARPAALITLIAVLVPLCAILIQPGSRQKLTISGYTIGPDFAVVSTTCPSLLRIGQSCNYVLSFRSLSTGTKSEVFKVIDSFHGSQMVKLHGIGAR